VSVRTCFCSDRNTNNIDMNAAVSNYTYYCPVNKKYCYVPIRSSKMDLSIYETYPYYYHPICIPTPTVTTYLARNIKLIGCAALALILIVLMISPSGHHAIRCCRTTFIPGCFMYNQRYTEYMIQRDPKLVKYYLERYLKDQDREERFNQRYIELQRLHGETVVEENATPEEQQEQQQNDGLATATTLTTTTTMAKTGTANTFLPLNEFEESIVRDMYYYRPSLVLKTRTYNGPSSTNTQQTTVASSKTSENSCIAATVASSPYDVDIAVQCSTEATKDMNLNSDSLSSPTSKNDDGCMICFNAIQVGSKVGVLPNCQHIFHTHCLKDWLKRRNVCPLCLDTDVAKVAFSRKNDAATTTNTTITIEAPPPSSAVNDSSSQTTTASEGR
jgi:hypothetical protein